MIWRLLDCELQNNPEKMTWWLPDRPFMTIMRKPTGGHQIIHMQKFRG
jgi:hypothetical protein